MRVLLAAMHAAKGQVDANLERHLEALEQARSAGCDIAVFPEFSLTGSVDPGRHPQRTLPVDAEPVRALVEFGSVRFGVAICAEGGVDFPWTQAAGAGASVMFFCSAPGLDGRRTD